MKKFLLITFLFTNYYIFSQNIEVPKIIEWNDDYELRVNSQQIFTLSFDNAVFDSEHIPVFNDVINLSDLNLNQDNINAEIIDIKYEVLTKHVTKIKNSSNIGSQINFKFNTNKGRDEYFIEYSFYPFINKNGQVLKITSFTLKLSTNYNKKQNNNYNYAQNSVLSNGNWIKIAIPEKGVYKLTFEELENLGFSSPTNVRVFGNDAGMLSFWNDNTAPDDLIENKIFKGTDFILFYADGATTWNYRDNVDMPYFSHRKNAYSDTAYYFLTDYNTGFNNTISTYNQPSNPTKTITTFDYYDFHEENSVNLIHTGRIWLGNEFLYAPQQTISFDLPNAVSGASGRIIVALANRSPVSSTMNISVEDVSKNISFVASTGVYYQRYVDYDKQTFDFTQNSSNLDINFSFNKPASSANSWIDYLIINAKCYLKYQNQLQFQSTENIGAGNVSKFEISDANNSMIIWDITNPTSPENINYSISGTKATFNSQTDTIRKFITFNSEECLTPVTEGANLGSIENQNLHNVPENTDMIIVTHPKFLSQANEISRIHSSHDNLNCIVVTTDQIYNEFSSGIKDVPAIRNYFKMVYDKTNNNLKYGLFFGDGTYFNIGETSYSNPNYIPTYQTSESFNITQLSTTNDDFFTFLDDGEGELTGFMDISVGRFPVKTTEEANTMVEKLNTYYNPLNFGDWHNILTFATDDRDKSSDNFVNDAETLSVLIDTTLAYLNLKKIYLDAYQQQTAANGEEYPDAFVEFNNRIKDGTLIVNYLGHGSEHALASEGLVTTTSINSWTNNDKLPLFITGTCEFSRFDEYYPNADATSGGEMIILNPNGGGIALLTTARVSYSVTNRYLNEKFYKFLFSKDNDGYNNTIGDAYRKAKNQMTSYHKFLFALLGDPAIRLQYPDNIVVPTTINGQDITTFADTLKALDTVSLTGYITDDNNNLLSDFDGILTLTYFDKKRDAQTLNNNGFGAMNYWSQYNKLFRGRAAINNGYFNINFIIPKDIYYSYGSSKFSFYAQSNDKQAAGQNRNVVLGGINANAPTDNTPPQIKLYMNDSSFVNGGITDADPAVFALLSDDNGINTSSASIGHDIAVMLDNNPNKTYSLNEYYKSDVNNYKKGSVSYQMFKLDPGTHTVRLKAWDIQNNSAEKSIEFIVAESNDLTISHLLNYPNPFTTNTNFYFEHNKPGITLDILLQITTVSGKVVKTIHTQMNTTGYRSDPINWNGLDDFGKPIGRGVYIYSLKIRTPNGKTVQKFEKLLILK